MITLLSPRYTANILGTIDAIDHAIQDAAGTSRVVLDMSILQVTSPTVLDSFESFDDELANRGIRFDVAALPGDAPARAATTGWWTRMTAEGRVHDSVSEAIAAAHDYDPIGVPGARVALPSSHDCGRRVCGVRRRFSRQASWHGGGGARWLTRAGNEHTR